MTTLVPALLIASTLCGIAAFLDARRFAEADYENAVPYQRFDALLALFLVTAIGLGAFGAAWYATGPRRRLDARRRLASPTASLRAGATNVWRITRVGSTPIVPASTALVPITEGDHAHQLRRWQFRSIQTIVAVLALGIVSTLGVLSVTSGEIYLAVPQLPRWTCAPPTDAEFSALEAADESGSLQSSVVKVRDISGRRIGAIRSGDEISVFAVADRDGAVEAVPISGTASEQGCVTTTTEPRPEPVAVEPVHHG